ncbi:MAG: DUF2721 domain-containing protein [Aliidongia sp.]
MSAGFLSAIGMDGSGDVAHLIQTALTPVFLLSGIGSLLNVFNTRLSRVSDHIGHAADLLRGETAPQEEAWLRRHFAHLARRMWLLDAAIALAAVGGASACGSAFVLFLGSVGNAAFAGWLIGLFSLSLGCTVCSLVMFLGDSVLAWHGLRREGPLPRSMNGPQK